MSSTVFYIEQERTVCEYIDDSERVFVFGVETSRYETLESAQQAALNLAVDASNTYKYI
ncbi:MULTISPECIES: hypothetical protein [Klebsiella/Raoultella group]|uniref:hypothetical protein n=1 Tax=Klebsiella/Raoultella group TaxID=2890311 RepID=UPI001C7D83AB|nr:MULTISPECIES: hypothetical protein [Klebsiella/Raoultella group]MDD9638927.1 hypothetical protein [Klebsiella michiganensis]